jgi:aromatic-L-amino-acid decarboxylase
VEQQLDRPTPALLSGLSQDFSAAATQHLDWLLDYFNRVRDLPVVTAVQPGETAAKLPPLAPDIGEPLDRILTDFESIILPALTLWNHPRFFAYFSVSSSPPSILADLLISALNVNAMFWKASPAATELEQVTLAWLREWLQLPPAFFGIIYDTASIGVLHALAAARERIDPEVRTRGTRNDLTIYISEQTHSSSEKAALTLGFGQQNVRKVPVDADFRMRADLLHSSIEQDIAAGKRPCCIVASIGSTSTSAIDPVPEIAAIAEHFGIWLHVDAAYAGSAAVLPEMQSTFAGAERADSVLLNPHKWLYVSIDCSVLYTRHPEILKRAFSLSADYLPASANDRELNYMDYGVQLGRRFRALKLWYVLRYYGREGISQLLRASIAYAQLFKELLEADPDFELCAPVPFSLVCFRHRSDNAFNSALLSAINASGKAFLSQTLLNGRVVLRFAIGNWQTTESDVRATWDLLRDSARRLTATRASQP